MAIPKNIIPDDEIARLCVLYWPEPRKYQAKVMMTIFLTETGGDANAIYMNQSGTFAKTLDRGLAAINEEAIKGVLGVAGIPAADFADPEKSVAMARAIWSWRFALARKRNMSYGEALVFAYFGWAVYEHKNEPPYDNAWPLNWARAGRALGV